MKKLQTIASLAAAGALLVVPAVGQADRPDPITGNHNHPVKGKSCAQKDTVKKGFVVRGTLAAGYVADNPGTPLVNEANVPVTVTGANRHARNAGVGGTYTANAAADSDDPFTVRLSGYEPGEVPATGPSVGDKVRVIGKVAVKRKKCFPALSVAARYGDVDIRRVKIIDAD